MAVNDTEDLLHRIRVRLHQSSLTCPFIAPKLVPKLTEFWNKLIRKDCKTGFPSGT
jgi:hypothetical protein